jgi:hypothetical protein
VFAKLIEHKANRPRSTSSLQREIRGLIAVDPEAAKWYGPRRVADCRVGQRIAAGLANSQRIAREWLAVPERSGSWLSPKLVRRKVAHNDYHRVDGRVGERMCRAARSVPRRRVRRPGRHHDARDHSAVQKDGRATEARRLAQLGVSRLMLDARRRR